MWKYYKDNANQLYAYPADGSQDAFIKPGLISITVEEADALRNPAPSLEELKAQKCREIDQETSVAILAGFDYDVAEHGLLHFSFDSFDQQNFVDAASLATLAIMSGQTGQSVTWNAYNPDGDLVRVTFNAQGFIGLYQFAVLNHKGALMEQGGLAKAQVMAIQNMEEWDTFVNPPPEEIEPEPGAEEYPPESITEPEETAPEDNSNAAV